MCGYGVVHVVHIIHVVHASHVVTSAGYGAIIGISSTIHSATKARRELLRKFFPGGRLRKVLEEVSRKVLVESFNNVFAHTRTYIIGRHKCIL